MCAQAGEILTIDGVIKDMVAQPLADYLEPRGMHLEQFAGFRAALHLHGFGELGPLAGYPREGLQALGLPSHVVPPPTWPSHEAEDTDWALPYIERNSRPVAPAAA